jgi:hypothetical protein
MGWSVADFLQLGLRAFHLALASLFKLPRLTL